MVTKQIGQLNKNNSISGFLFVCLFFSRGSSLKEANRTGKELRSHSITFPQHCEADDCVTKAPSGFENPQVGGGIP